MDNWPGDDPKYEREAKAIGSIGCGFIGLVLALGAFALVVFLNL